MILNVFSITEIFIGTLSAILMLWGGTLSLILALRWRKASTMQERSEIEKRSHLVLLVAVVVLGIRLFNWPLFYATLQSFVPEIDGAMCIFGVTQVKRLLTGTAEIIKPFSFFLIGAWLLIHVLDQKTQTSALMGRKLFFLSITALVVITEAVLDVLLMFKIAPGTLVSCCTTVTDIIERPTRLLPKSFLGPGYESILNFGYYASNLLLLFAIAACLWRLKRGSIPRWRRSAMGLIFLWGIGNAALFILTQIEVHAPKIMGLPFHHCLYCLWQYVPDTILMYLLFVLGTASTGWAFVLDWMGRTGEAEEILPSYLRMIYAFAIFCFAASMVMNMVHLMAS
jgi:uncharacterized membrane protein YiaA